MVVEGYASIIVFLISGLLVPCAALVWSLRPNSYRQLFRGGEVAGYTILTVDCIRRLVLIASGVVVAYPGDGWALFNVTFLGFTILLAWMRVAQQLRHRMRNRENIEVGKAELRAMGYDIDGDIAKMKEEKDK